MEQTFMAARPTLDQLRHIVNNYPIIDNHAHNLILPTQSDTIPFETITTEAQGRALNDTFKSLPHLRAEMQLRQLYECGEDADWEDIVEQRTEWIRTDPERLHRRCFEGVYTLLIDDGLARSDKVYPYDYHDKFTKAPCKRIVRIEAVAERLMKNIVRNAKEDDLEKAKFLPDTFVAFTEGFEREIEEAIKNPAVAGFKTVVCYRSGLDIEHEYEQAARAVGRPFERYVRNCIRKKNYRIDKKSLNDYIVLRTLEILSDQLPRSEPFSKPLQFHTGLGDNDISLLESNPGHMQPLIENYPTVPIVLLHAAYPYTREAGYLATVYRHVYLDVGEVFPMLSRDGQVASLRQAMELTPCNKLLYSSDGHWFSETFWLANLQFRAVWLELLTEYVQKGDLTTHQAISITKDVLFHNANTLYNLNYEVLFDDVVQHPPKQLTYNSRLSTQTPYPVTPTSQSLGVVQPSVSTPAPSPISPGTVPTLEPQSKTSQVYDVPLFEKFCQQNPSVKFIYVQWLDYMATVHARIIPIKEFTRIIYEGDRISVSQGSTGTLQDDTPTSAVDSTGQIYVEPDLRSLRLAHNKDPLPSATVLSYWRNESGQPSPECPRNNLETLINTLQYTYSSTLLVGFGVEVTFLSRNPSNVSDPYSPLTKTHAWGVLTPEQWLQLPFLCEIVIALEQMGIEVEQFHAESGQGQYEFVLLPRPPLLAVDTLIQTRQVIAQIAALHGFRATLHPKPFKGMGSAAHAHVLLHPPDRDMAFFVGGVLEHLRATCAFSMPEPVSYGRVVDNQWTSGTYLSWGTKNRKVPLRRVSAGRWEIRTIDGLANMYFVLSAIIASGLLGLSSASSTTASSQKPMPQNADSAAAPQYPTETPHPIAFSNRTDTNDSITTPSNPYAVKDFPYHPASLDHVARAEHGITQHLPASLDEAMAALGRDGHLREGLGPWVRSWVVMKKQEQKMLQGMGEEERRVWLVERY